MPQTIRHAHPGLKPLPEAFNPTLLRLVHLSLPLLVRFRLRPWLPAGITQIEATNVDRLVSLYHQFQAGKIRFIMAFRHVEVDDPLCGLYLMSRLIPQAAKQQGVKLHYPLHAHFLYDRGMPLWGGKWLGWSLSHLGGVSLHRGKHPDWRALRIARDLVVNGNFPLVVAPEGATNGHSERLNPLEPGTAQLAFWCVEDLLKAGRPETVWLIPVGIQYRYLNSPWHKLDALMSQLEAETGLPVQSIGSGDRSDREQVFYQRLLRLGEHVLAKMERFYIRFYHRQLPESGMPVTQSLEFPDPTLATRLHTLLDNALRVAEEYFGISAQGNFNDRCRRLEEAGWTYIYRPDLEDPTAISVFDRGLADWVASEASLQILHMRLVESVVAVTGSYVREKPTFERFAETTLLMFDVMARIRGDKLPARPRLGYRHAQITVTEPLLVNDRWSQYQVNRAAARRAVADLTQEMQRALESTILN